MASSWTLREVAGDPTVVGGAQVTGLNGSAFMPGTEFPSRRDADINGVMTALWRLPEDPQGTALDYVTFNAVSTRIGKKAFVRLLQAMDSRSESPQFQNAIMALSLGTPSGASMSLENSLVTMSGSVRLVGGIELPVPVLDRTPLGDVIEVYGLGDTTALLGVTRWGLRLLLAEDLDALERRLGEAP